MSTSEPPVLKVGISLITLLNLLLLRLEHSWLMELARYLQDDDLMEEQISRKLHGYDTASRNLLVDGGGGGCVGWWWCMFSQATLLNVAAW